MGFMETGNHLLFVTRKDESSPEMKGNEMVKRLQNYEFLVQALGSAGHRDWISASFPNAPWDANYNGNMCKYTRCNHPDHGLVNHPQQPRNSHRLFLVLLAGSSLRLGGSSDGLSSVLALFAYMIHVALASCSRPFSF